MAPEPLPPDGCIDVAAYSYEPLGILRELWRVECLGCGCVLGAFPEMPTNDTKDSLHCCDHYGKLVVAPVVE